MKKIFVNTFYCVIIAGVIAIFSAKSYAEDVPAIEIKKDDLMKIQPGDAIMGCENAPNLMIEYSSLGCPHCAQYYRESFAKIKANFIDTCKLKYVYRDFPTTRPALRAAVLAKCVATSGGNSPLDSKKYFDMLGLFFSTQQSWAFNIQYDENLARIAGINGISNELVQSCLNNNMISMQIVNQSFAATKTLNLRAAPTIILNGEIVVGANYDKIVSMIK